MALSWTNISGNTVIRKQIIDEIFSNLRKVESSVGGLCVEGGSSSTGGTSSLVKSKDLVDIYRRINEAYWIKFSRFPVFNHAPSEQGQFSIDTIVEIRNILNSFGV